MPPKCRHLSRPKKGKSKRARLFTGFMGANGGKGPSVMVRAEEVEERGGEVEEGRRRRKDWSMGRDPEGKEWEEEDEERNEQDDEEDEDGEGEEEDTDEDEDQGKEEAAEAEEAETAAEDDKKSWSTDDDEIVIGAMQAKGHLMFIDDICDDLETVFEHRLLPRSSVAIR